VQGFDAGAIAALQQYAWPGNVRELNSVVERSLLLAAGNEIGTADLRLSAAKVRAALARGHESSKTRSGAPDPLRDPRSTAA
jgi:DNA-binding NtrC family response regulator